MIEQVRRNYERLPSDFIFESTPEEFEDLRPHSGTSNIGGERQIGLRVGELKMVHKREKNKSKR